MLVQVDEGDRVTSTGPGGGRAQRADARRNVAAILDAALVCLQRDPGVSVGDIAAAAGVGRITLYGHFRSRADLVEAVLDQTMLRADAVLDDVELSGDPAEALARLVGTSWRIVEQSRSILQASQRELPPERIRAAHERVVTRIVELLERGRREGAFRQDLPTGWLAAVSLSLVHAAADEVEAGRLDGESAGWYLTTTLLGALAPPGAGRRAGAEPAPDPQPTVSPAATSNGPAS
jgi:AcrR family transcriptional regulator